MCLEVTRQARNQLGVKCSYHNSREVCCLLLARPGTWQVTCLPQQTVVAAAKEDYLGGELPLCQGSFHRQSTFLLKTSFFACREQWGTPSPAWNNRAQPEPGSLDNGSQGSLFTLLKSRVNVFWLEVKEELSVQCWLHFTNTQLTATDPSNSSWANWGLTKIISATGSERDGESRLIF